LLLGIWLVTKVASLIIFFVAPVVVVAFVVVVVEALWIVEVASLPWLSIEVVVIVVVVSSFHG
jgi:hypothetical protein